MSLTAKWDIKESQQRKGIIRKRLSKVGEGIKEGTASKSLKIYLEMGFLRDWECHSSWAPVLLSPIFAVKVEK